MPVSRDRPLTHVSELFHILIDECGAKDCAMRRMINRNIRPFPRSHILINEHAAKLQAPLCPPRRLYLDNLVLML